MYLRAHLCTQVPLGAARVEVVHAKLKWRQIKWGATVSGRESPPPAAHAKNATPATLEHAHSQH